MANNPVKLKTYKTVEDYIRDFEDNLEDEWYPASTNTHRNPEGDDIVIVRYEKLSKFNLDKRLSNKDLTSRI